MSRPIKRSFSIAGHRTSISLEAAFWVALKDAAAREHVPLAQLVARIDEAETAPAYRVPCASGFSTTIERSVRNR